MALADSKNVYAERVNAYQAQMARVAPSGADRWAARAVNFRLNPARPLEANTGAIVGMIKETDVVVDVGGGAGRVGLPAALVCREVINVEPSAGMREQFQESAAEAGIRNARCVAAAWPAASADVKGDVVMVANVTYFVRDIVPFVEALTLAARRRVIVSVWSIPPPNHSAALFELLHGESQAPAPTHRELLPVLWDLGLLPDIQVLPDEFRAARERPPTREDAIRLAIERATGEQIQGAAQVVEDHFNELYAPSAEGFVPMWTPQTREMLISWPAG